MTQQKKASTVNWPDKAQFYLQGMSMENSLLQSYRMIFGAIEAILFFVWLQPSLITWFQPPSRSPLVAGLGITFCIAWVLVCLHRGRQVTAWKRKVVEVTRRTEVGRFVHERLGRSVLFVLQARFWLSLLPLGLMVLWVYLAISSNWGWVGMLSFEVVLLSFLWKKYDISLFRS